ncbi:hypothetical protein HX744_03730 [Pseudonocardia sp. ICBG1122]|nr:hypothetical protein [Pseudonocardia pini]
MSTATGSPPPRFCGASASWRRSRAWTLLCSQGGVIPDVVGHLLAATGRSADPDLPSHKASTWVLGFDAAGGLLSADYYRRPPA